jgi:MoaA/NifB/PqqE/SkfB family radical SAM enzyme
MLSIEITRECPLNCPGCYAYGEDHLGGEVNLRSLADYKGDALVEGVVGLVKHHKALHVSLVGGEPMMRHRELQQILPRLSAMRVFTLLVTSAVIRVPREWMQIPRLRVAVSIDGLPEHHDVRRKPATYERILRNIEGCNVNIHLTVTRPMMERDGYLDEYMKFWTSRPEIDRIWLSVYTPQIGEQTPEMLTPEHRRELVRLLPELKQRYPALLMNEGIAQAYFEPPQNPRECTFSKMSVNYSADLKTRVEPCIFGGAPDCSQCGCAVSAGFHWLAHVKIAGPFRMGHLVRSSVAIGSVLGRLRPESFQAMRWDDKRPMPANGELVQIGDKRVAAAGE